MDAIRAAMEEQKASRIHQAVRQAQMSERRWKGSKLGKVCRKTKIQFSWGKESKSRSGQSGGQGYLLGSPARCTRREKP